MPGFVPKDWQDSPSTSTPISAAALEDLETRVAGWADTRALFVNVKTDFGAVGDGSADDTAAIQAAIDSLPALTAEGLDLLFNGKRYGGTVFFPPGTYKITSSINLDDTRQLTLVGAGTGWGSGFSIRAASNIVSTQTGSGNIFSCQSSSGLNVRNLGVHYSSTSFTGDVFDFQHSALAADAGAMLFENVLIGGVYDGATPRVSATGLNLNQAILGTFRNVRFSYLQYGVRGVISSYSNAFYFDNCMWEHCREACIADCGEGWTVVSPFVELLTTLSGDGIKTFYKDVVAHGSPHDLTIVGGWLADASGDLLSMFDADNLLRLSVNGGYYAHATGDDGGVKGGKVLAVTGSNLGPINRAATGQGIAMGNDLVGVSNEPFPRANDAVPFVTLGNNDNLGRHRDELMMFGHLILAEDFTGNEPAIAKTAAAGTTSTVAVAVGDSDQSGTITLVCSGTGQAAGELVQVTFDKAFKNTNNIAGSKVFLEPKTSATAALGHFRSAGPSVDYAGWGLATVNAPAAGTTYVWDYFVER